MAEMLHLQLRLDSVDPFQSDAFISRMANNRLFSGDSISGTGRED